MKRYQSEHLTSQNNALLGQKLKNSKIIANLLGKTNITEWRQRNNQFLLNQYIQNLKGPSGQYNKVNMNLYLDCQVQKHRFQEDRFDYDVKNKLWNSCKKVQNGEDQQYKVALYDYVDNITEIIFWKSVPFYIVPLTFIKCKKYKQFTNNDVEYIISTFNLVRPTVLDYFKLKVVYSCLLLIVAGAYYLSKQTGRNCIKNAFNYLISWIPFRNK